MSESVHKGCLRAGVECYREEYAALYSHLAKLESWYSRLSDHGLLVAIELIVRRHIGLRSHDQPADMETVLRSLDAKTGEAEPTPFTLFKFNLINKSAAKGADKADRRSGVATGCPMPGASCPRGAHIDWTAKRLP